MPQAARLRLKSFRILTAVGPKMPRTVRLAYGQAKKKESTGSRLMLRSTCRSRSDEADGGARQDCAYYNLDNGTGKIRGVYLQGNDMARPDSSPGWRPLRTRAWSGSIRNTGGTDHLSFDAVGIPGFQFIQDPVEYNTRTHHSNMDLYDRLQPGDLMQASP